MLTVRQVKKSYGKKTWFSDTRLSIIKGVSFECSKGECLGIIGESGSGKSTLGRMILGIEKPDSGSIRLDGEEVGRKRKGRISVVFQDYRSSINPFFTVKKALAEPLRGKMETGRLVALLEQVGLDRSYLNRYPHELSGGEAQRVCIARAIATEPDVLILDEAISSLDIPVQIQILKLLKHLNILYQMSCLFITHDIQAAAYLCNRIMIFRDGEIEEMTDIQQLGDVTSPYAQKLLKSLITF